MHEVTCLIWDNGEKDGMKSIQVCGITSQVSILDIMWWALLENSPGFIALD